MQLYGLKTCDTCRKALKLLDNAEFVDLRADGIPEALLDRALVRFGDKLLNTRSTTWRTLSPDDRRRPPAELIREFPAVMKRPLIDSDGILHLGWTPQVRSDLGVG